MNPQEVEHISQRADDQSARDCQSHAARTSGKTDPADHARGDRVQEIGLALDGVNGVQLRAEQNACDGGTKPRKRIDEKFQPVDVDSLLPHDGLIATEGIDAIPCRSELGDEDPDSHHHDQEKVRDRDAEDGSIAKEHIGGRKPTDRMTVVHDEGQPLTDLSDNQRGDEGRHAQLRNHQTVE
jgi:hypothetical protein